MDLELRIAQYIDGDLSGEEEGELHHLLAVSPEARALFRQHLTLHTVARDERVLHRPTQSMRDDLFARLQAEEGMKPPAILPVASVAADAPVVPDGRIPADSPSRAAADRAPEGRPPVSSAQDPRTEERRRRRRLIPILIPLLLCVIVGGVWYGGRSGGDGAEDYAYAAAEAGSRRQAPAPAGGEYEKRTEDMASSGGTSAFAAAPEAVAESSHPETSRERSFRRSAPSQPVRIESEPELMAEATPRRESHDVLGISSTRSQWPVDNTPVDFDAESVMGNSEDMAAARMAPPAMSADLGVPPVVFGGNVANGAAIIPEPSFSAAVAERDSEMLAPVDLADADNGFLPNPPLSVFLSNSVERVDFGSRDDDDAHPVRIGRLTDSSTGLPIVATMENYREIAAMLEASGLDTDGDGRAIPSGPVNPGTRAMNERAYEFATAMEPIAPEGKGANDLPAVMSDQDRAASVDSLPAARKMMAETDTKTAKNVPSEAVPTSIRRNKVDSRSPAAETVAEVSLDLSEPRRLNFFVGIDQSIGAAVSTVQAVLPSPTANIPPFSDGGRIFPETRIAAGIDFDGGRQRVFAAVGMWAYDERTSVRSTSSSAATLGNSVVNRVTTVARQEEKMAYEVWGGAGYRYTVRLAEDWSAGAEVWGGVGAEYFHGGLSVPFSYKLKENLHVEFAPGMRYRALHGEAEQATTGGVASATYTEQVVMPDAEQRLDASFGIGLILLLR